MDIHDINIDASFDGEPNNSNRSWTTDIFGCYLITDTRQAQRLVFNGPTIYVAHVLWIIRAWLGYFFASLQGSIVILSPKPLHRVSTMHASRA